ncbi:hypothetical protein SAMN05660865_00836 [Caloramator fervidus]|uniref:Uncharacterized protein n=1 Tax=Caloramator fervidus TaxID=29344 RepID=A0A1H5UBK6_9CLOT|nr:hypothetical protein [Caloramator fervidus]SEF71637.1 hypothetical protein SAMN05660865_00836 [Caloramator fervidus]
MTTNFNYGSHKQFRCIKEVLEELKGKEVIIVLKGCCEECVKILAVCDKILVAAIPGKCYPIKFIDIDCICEVITDCKTVVKAFLDECC